MSLGIADTIESCELEVAFWFLAAVLSMPDFCRGNPVDTGASYAVIHDGDAVLSSALSQRRGYAFWQVEHSARP